MENGARKKLRDITGRLRQVLENDFRTNTDGGESIKSKAWRWAIHLAVEQAMTVRGICGEMSDLSTVAACRLNDRPSAGAEQCCRDLLAGREEEPNPFIAADALGWLHQYWYDGERQAITAKSGGDQYSKITAAEIIPATQVYTEKYIVDFLLKDFGWLGSLVAAGFATCGALRLARFNVNVGTVKGYFMGLPIPAAGCVVATFVMIGVKPPGWVFPVMVAGFGYLMVSTIKYPDFKGKGEKNRVIPAVLTLLLSGYILFLSWQSLPFVVFFGYVVFGILNTIFALFESRPSGN